MPTDPTRVVLLDDYQQVALDLLDVGTDIEAHALRTHVEDDDLVAALKGAEVVVAMRERTALPRSVLERLPDLRLLVTTGMGNAAIDVEAATELGVCVSGTGGLVTSTSELTWGLVFALLRHIPAEDARLRDGGWQSTVGVGLAGKTMALVGAGRIGKLVAAAAQAFRMSVIAWSQNLSAERAAAVGAELVSKEELFARADVLSIHLVLSDRTRGVVGESELRAMKPTAFLINTSRGPIVDESALLRALREQWIAGAGLDVYDHEPLPADHPLRSMPNTVLTPHLGYVTDDTYDIFYREIGEDIAAFVGGQPIRVINPGWDRSS
jgi:phosphoglycerate dehydrogenase-like enzyme